MRLRVPRTRRRVLAWLAVLAVFVAALVAWSHDSPQHPVQIQGALDPAPKASAPGHSRHAKPGANSRKGSRPDPLSRLSDLLPAQSRSVDAAPLPTRAVVITLTSDAAILRMGYIVRHGHPGRYRAQNVASPVRIAATARGYGLVAAVGAQASPLSSYLTCTVTVDGQLHSAHTVHGGFTVAVCVG